MIELSDNIVSYLSGLYGKESVDKYLEFIKYKHTTYLRINQTFSEVSIQQQLTKYGIKLEKVPEIPFAYKVLEGEDIIGKTLEHSLGRYYIQSLSSMIPPLILSPSHTDRVMDTCSAPGSKATQIAEMMNNKGTLIVNEPNSDRIKSLVHNIDRANLINVGVIQNRGDLLSQVYNEHFDKILVDAPCSALGVIQKKGEVSNWWSIERVNNLTPVQLAILTAAVKMVKIGGEIVYSTCTLTAEENELIINHILNKYPVEAVDIELPVKSIAGFTVYKNGTLHPGLKKARRILPWEVDSEGFFIIKLRKFGSAASVQKPVKISEAIEFISHKNKRIEKYLIDLSSRFGIEQEIWKNYKFLIKGSDLSFINEDWNDDNLQIFNRVGTKLGMIDKHGFAHLHTYAAQYFGSKIKSNIYLIKNSKQLKEYFSGGIVRTGESLKGQFIISFNDYILGTAAGVSNGLKSQYPKSKRLHEITYY